MAFGKRPKIVQWDGMGVRKNGRSGTSDRKPSGIRPKDLKPVVRLSKLGDIAMVLANHRQGPASHPMKHTAGLSPCFSAAIGTVEQVIVVSKDIQTTLCSTQSYDHTILILNKPNTGSAGKASNNQ